ncbi:MAG: hypothetical protein UR25_C0003G0037 [Candidatus Nomurabacteria bacterium GW2011_GWE1_32_28]|uniref:Uncharacterized protein n=1 Tax=Candidatus Nomurabacteria bacterium GW2011_GWF1_31_48 TaxID=1618767 RepID=A0A0F9YF11_9BACT|nr:MAG: hypothetical protein UR10_C0003G0037 [Candidatus Nomurabacteria bacterium GW2011_GWF2_30_133]KKP28677.1 MAG: hypothetical protein UR18_C0002G0089 [Candidatus Nomurabacteria bacterium GW2011_GWE2_31_40]KKP30254.1 MAG: hypothetical protein UR19_C0003G0090 [Candidatus Nomurabacteria bacterium GW2011_GWF1_31_48]KKP34781.1 MAG: hypothetical protein UR25_C0003G0037 [Candidatus Nomurabacteria bacterium GW2011_GWE1_32_28]HAS80761.1 hypothetical protein [Candidatus Nomurabacteria bacterium]
MTFFDKIKQKIWDYIYSFFLPTRKFLLKTGIIWHKKGRQKYHIGWLAPGKSLEALKLHLNAKWGFGNHFIAWIDEDQVLSWRKLMDFEEQYHLRIYKDGEICGHFEFTPESHPFKHMEERGEIDKREDFLKFLGDFVVQKKYISHLKLDPDAFDPKSEITIEEN